MPVVHKSTIKRARQAEKRRLRNRAVLTTVKSHIRRVVSALEEKKSEQLDALLRDATSAIAKAASKGVLKRNTANRRISRLASKVNELKAGQDSAS
jgi:small subunit ribosomal protein S20